MRRLYAARRVGCRASDVQIAISGCHDLMTEQNALTHVVERMMFGERDRVDVLSGNRRINFTLPIQK